MKKISALKAAVLFFSGLFLTASLFQCTKQGELAEQFDRSFTLAPDSTLFSPFYDSVIVPGADKSPDVNDVVKVRSVQNIVDEYCGSTNCHGQTVNHLGQFEGPKVSPRIHTYDDVMKFVNAGSPETSELWELITTNDFNKAMPPVNLNHELKTTDKAIIYNWIKNGAKENPSLTDYRPAAINLIATGCTSGNCHNQATATGVWARSGLVPGITSADTVKFTVTGSTSSYCQLTNKTKMDDLWKSYKDSVKKFYADTNANASFRPWKTFGTPTTLQSVRGPLNDYDDIIMDVWYPKSNRTGTTVRYTDPSGKKFYVKNTYLDATSTMITRVDSTLQIMNPHTGVWTTSLQGGMARADGNLSPTEIAIIKGWYFTDPNVPDVWKYGKSGEGIFRYKKTMNLIKK